LSSSKTYGSDGFSETDNDVKDTMRIDGFGGFLSNNLEGSGKECISGEDGNIFSVNDLL